MEWAERPANIDWSSAHIDCTATLLTVGCRRTNALLSMCLPRLGNKPNSQPCSAQDSISIDMADFCVADERFLYLHTRSPAGRARTSESTRA
eukprot:6461525-Amphidinium_carterae.1